MEQEVLDTSTPVAPTSDVPENITQPVENLPVTDNVETSQQASPSDVSAESAETEERTHGSSLLSEAMKPEDPKVDKKTDELKTEEKTPESKEEVKPTDPVSYEQFTLPEGVSMPKEYFDKFTGVIGKFGVSQEVAQDLINMHIESIKDLSQKALADQWSVFDSQQKEWKSDVMADPILGGSGHNTAMATAAKGIESLQPNAEKRARALQILDMTGAGNHKEIIEMFYNAGKTYGEPERPISEGIKPPPDRGSKPTGKLSNIYTHPTSQQK